LGNQWGNFELNTMMPVVAHNLLQAIAILASASRNFAEQCIAGLAATRTGPDLVERGLMLATALAPVVGYDKAAEIAKLADRTGRTIREVAPAACSARLVGPARRPCRVLLLPKCSLSRILLGACRLRRARSPQGVCRGDTVSVSLPECASVLLLSGGHRGALSVVGRPPGL